MSMGAGGQLAYGLYLGNEDEHWDEGWQEQVFDLMEDFDSDDDFILKVTGAPEELDWEQKREYLAKSPFEIVRMGYYEYSQLVLAASGSVTEHYSWEIKPIDLSKFVSEETTFKAQMESTIKLLGIELPPDVTFQWFLGADYG